MTYYRNEWKARSERKEMMRNISCYLGENPLGMESLYLLVHKDRTPGPYKPVTWNGSKPKQARPE